MADGISVGDAVMTFWGDTTRLDQSFANVRQTAAQTSQTVAQVSTAVETIPPVPPDVPESFVPVKVNAREARGEVMLLGEAIGVRLPRHVAAFLTELPGVGQALNAAFAATAVGFLAVAFVEITEKVSEFTAAMIYGTGAAKENMDAEIALNKVIADLAAQYATTKEKVDDYGKSQLTLATDSIAKAIKATKEAKEAVDEQTQSLKEAKLAADELAQEQSAITYWQALKNEAGIYTEALKGVITGSLTFSQAIAKMTDENGAAAPAIAKIADETNDLAKSQQDLKLKQEQAALASKEYLSTLTAEFIKLETAEAKQDAAWAKQGEAIAAANQEYKNLGLSIAKSADNVDEIAIKMPAAAAAFLKIGAAMQVVGINTNELQTELVRQKGAFDTVQGAYEKGNVTLRQYQQAQLSEAQAERAVAASLGENTKALDAYIAGLERAIGGDNRKEKSYQKLTQADRQFAETLAETGSKSQATWQASANAMGQAVAAYANGGESMGQALEKMAQAEIASLSERAIIYAIFELGKGFATMFDDPPASAAHFTAAAEFGLLGAAGAVVAHEMGGGTSGGSSGSTAAGKSSGASGNAATATSTQAPTTVINVQRLGGGGIVTAPTLAMVGDAPGGSGRQEEAILPLSDSSAMDSIAEAITKRMGGSDGGSQIHVHVAGLISPDNLNKVITQINQRVKSGKSNLTSSNSMRVTKRSQ